VGIKMVTCSVLGAKVPCLMDLGGDPIRVICAARDESTGLCRLKKGPSEGGPLSQLLAHVNERHTSMKGRACHLRGQ
jgi:hypothetical protein